jgi:hypothetical protein
MCTYYLLILSNTYKIIIQNFKEFWIAKKLVNLIKMMLQDSNGKVKIQGQLTKERGIERG